MSWHNEITSTIIEWLKTFWYFVAVFTFDYLEIPQSQLSILGALMVVDVITGIAKVYRVNPSHITSHDLGMWVLKKFLTVLIVYTIALVAKGVGIPASHFLEWGLSILIMAEWYSAIQNIYAFRTWKVLPEYDVISIILKWMSKYLEDKINKTIQK